MQLHLTPAHSALARHEPEVSDGLVTSCECLELFIPEGCRLYGRIIPSINNCNVLSRYSEAVPRDVIIACSHSGMCVDP